MQICRDTVRKRFFDRVKVILRVARVIYADGNIAKNTSTSDNPAIMVIIFLSRKRGFVYRKFRETRRIISSKESRFFDGTTSMRTIRSIGI